MPALAAMHDALTPAAAMPWPVVSPFRMRPGLSRLVPDAATPHPAQQPPGPPALFLRDDRAAAYAAAKQRALARHPPPGQADPAVLRAVAEAYRRQTGVVLPPQAQALAMGMQEDFVILHDETEPCDAGPDAGPDAGGPGESGHLGEGSGGAGMPAGADRGADAGTGTLRARYLSVCFPSHWAPAEKLGLDFTAIHAPVADNALLQAGARGIVQMAFRQSSMLRHVWLLSPGADLAQHPEGRRTRWEDALAQADACGGRLMDRVFFRVERQTTLPLPALRRGVFFIRVLVCPLGAVLAEAPGRAAALADALSSMSPAVLAYRGLGAVRDRLCRELVA